MNSENQAEAYDDHSTGIKIPVLVSIAPGFLRDSLITILQSFSFVLVIEDTSGEHRGPSIPCPSQPLIVLIKWLPDDSGRVAFFQAIHAANPKNKILVITDISPTRRQALENGADAVITYGFTSRDLALAIRRLALLQQGQRFQAPQKKVGQVAPTKQKDAGK